MYYYYFLDSYQYKYIVIQYTQIYIAIITIIFEEAATFPFNYFYFRCFNVIEAGVFVFTVGCYYHCVRLNGIIIIALTSIKIRKKYYSAVWRIQVKTLKSTGIIVTQLGYKGKKRRIYSCDYNVGRVESLNPIRHLNCKEYMP